MKRRPTDREVAAVVWMYGMTTKEAKNYIKDADESTIREIVLCYLDQRRKIFHYD